MTLMKEHPDNLPDWLSFVILTFLTHYLIFPLFFLRPRNLDSLLELGVTLIIMHIMNGKDFPIVLI